MHGGHCERLAIHRGRCAYLEHVCARDSGRCAQHRPCITLPFHGKVQARRRIVRLLAFGGQDGQRWRWRQREVRRGRLAHVVVHVQDHIARLARHQAHATRLKAYL